MDPKANGLPYHWTELLDAGDQIKDVSGNVFEVIEPAAVPKPVSPHDWASLNLKGVRLRRVRDGREVVARLQTVSETCAICN